MQNSEWIAIGVAAFGLIGWAIKDRMKVQKDISEIRLNYLDRFASLEEKVTDGNAEVIQAIGELKVDFAKNYMAKSECPLIHGLRQ